MTTKAAPVFPPRSRLEPEPVPRRDFLGLAAAWTAGSALVFATLGMLRLPKAAVIPAPSSRFRIALPDSLAPGTFFVPRGRPLAIARDSSGVYAISLVCTHLGCIVQVGPDGFRCPCHGSQFAPDGSVIRGPAPKGLPWLEIRRDPSGLYLVDAKKTVPAGTKETA
jgi:nitrite reductase/ring-hydroxylating ferredoxin subunit